MLGSEFLTQYANKPFQVWEKVALDLAQSGEGFVDWPLVEVPIQDDQGNTAVLTVASDVLAIGTDEDHIRLPLLPTTAQSILNLSGALLPTPWLVYQMYRASPVKLDPIPMVPNMGANLQQYAAHSQAIDVQKGSATGLVAGIKKHIVIDGAEQVHPGTVLIFGWYRPPPAPDVFDDRRAMTAPDRQPIQPFSWAHGDFYVDYSHGVQAVMGVCTVNGQEMFTADLYAHPTLSRLVSNTGPVRVPRYKSPIPPAPPPALNRPYSPMQGRAAIDVVLRTPSILDRGYALAARSRG